MQISSILLDLRNSDFLLDLNDSAVSTSLSNSAYDFTKLEVDFEALCSFQMDSKNSKPSLITSEVLASL